MWIGLSGGQYINLDKCECVVPTEKGYWLDGEWSDNAEDSATIRHALDLLSSYEAAGECDEEEVITRLIKRAEHDGQFGIASWLQKRIEDK